MSGASGTSLEGCGIAYGELPGGDHGLLLEMYRRLYPQLGWTREFMRWQYHDNPAGTARAWVARDAGTVIASYVGIPHAIRCDDDTAIGYRVQDVLVDPAYRGRGVYRRLSGLGAAALMRPELPLNFTFPNELSHRMFVADGWLEGNRVPLWVGRDSEVETPVTAPWTADPIIDFDERHEAIWRAHRAGTRFAVERTAAYLRWRYRENPRGGYHPMLLGRGDRSAVAVLKLFDGDDGERRAHLCDWITDAPDDESAAGAVDYFLRFADAHGCAKLSVWTVDGSVLSRALAAAGFTLVADLTRWQVLNPNGVDAGAVCTPADWHVAMGDTDVY
ncbi:MAG: GNAT family N-acetyltransferase [Planctomycetes bacterium]|nr:GNAT family N-acetyltransferase [Planctomycetota bacterium]